MASVSHLTIALNLAVFIISAGTLPMNTFAFREARHTPLLSRLPDQQRPLYGFQIKFAEGVNWSAEEIFGHYNREMREQGYDTVLQAQRRGIVKNNFERRQIRERQIRDRKKENAALKKYLKEENYFAVFDYNKIVQKIALIESREKNTTTTFDPKEANRTIPIY